MTNQTTDAETTYLKPQLILLAQDYERLSILARAAMNKMPELAEGLSEELERAHVVDKGQHPQQVVCMGCNVEFRNDTTGKIQNVTLVYPAQADISQGKISVLTPVGTALIGLRVGQSITWDTRTGETRRLTVLEVRGPQMEQHRLQSDAPTTLLRRR
jgi:regulator of nucleoside diphosphate kinase